MTTLFSIFALRGRDRDNPSLRGRSKGVGGDEMSITIENKAPFCRYGNIVINKVYVHSVKKRWRTVIRRRGVGAKILFIQCVST